MRSSCLTPAALLHVRTVEMLLSQPEAESFRVQVLRMPGRLDGAAVRMGQYHHVFHPQVQEGVIKGGRHGRLVGPCQVAHVPEHEKFPGPGVENVLRNDPAVGAYDDERVRSLPGAEGAIGVPVGPLTEPAVSLKKSVHEGNSNLSRNEVVSLPGFG